MNSAIEQKANSITSSVFEKYSTKQETNTAKAEAINSANKFTDDKLKNYSTTTQMNSTITQKANEIKEEVSNKYAKQDALEEEKSERKQTATQISNEVSKKVNNDDFSTKLSMDYESVQIAWNKISEFIQFLNAQLQIRDANKKILMTLDKTGLKFYHNELFTGEIASTSYKQDSNQKGLAFDLNENGKFMCWGKISEDKQSYITKLWYNVANSFGNEKEGLYLGTNLDLNNYKIIGEAIEIYESTLYRGDDYYLGVHLVDNVSEIALLTRKPRNFIFISRHLKQKLKLNNRRLNTF